MNPIKQSFGSLAALLYKFRKKEVVQLQNEFETRQWWDTDKIQAESDRLTRRLVQHSSKHVPYYKQLFQNIGINPKTCTFPEEWEKLPVLDKKILHNHYKDLISTSSHGANSYVNHSGGSTGSPAQFLTDLTVYKRMVAWQNLTFSWAGWRLGEIQLNLWGGKDIRFPLTIQDIIRASLAGSYTIPVYEYTEKKMQQWWEIILKLQPTVVYGYPSVLNDFSQWLDSAKLSPKGIKGVFSTAEVLYPKQRINIENTFNCKVFNQYGSRETPCVASECPEGEMHIFCDVNRIEFIDSGLGPDGDKDIIVTPLYDYAQPLLRYQLGDMGKPKSGLCKCGRGYPLMELNVARSRDFLFSHSGSKIYPGFFTRLMDGKEWVQSFQFVQTSISRIELNLEVTTQGETEQFRQQLYSELLPTIESRTGSLEDFTINIVDEINRTRAGKHRFVVNEIPQGDK